jgi:hypothetical protein
MHVHSNAQVLFNAVFCLVKGTVPGDAGGHPEIRWNTFDV